jgi:hypothetical protein
LVAWLATAITVRAAYEPYQLPDPTRRWSVNVSLREGYSDNVFTTQTNKQDSLTTSIEPTLLLNFPMERTFMGLRYGYGATYYSDRPGGKIDQYHTVDVLFSHQFNTRLTLDMKDNIRRGIEPELVESFANGPPITTRRRGDYLYNSIDGTLVYALAQRWAASLGGVWQYWRFDETTNAVVNDRDIYQANAAIIFAVSPRTHVGVNYQLERSEFVGTNSARNATAHTGFLSLARQFSPKLSLQANGGMEIREFDDGTSQTAPSASVTASYNYGPDSAISAGFAYQISTTEAGGFRSTDSTSLFGSVNHRLTARLQASASIAYSISTFQNPISGSSSQAGLEENAFRTGFSLTYAFRRWLSADLTYTYEELRSDVPDRNFERNRVDLGVRFIY